MNAILLPDDPAAADQVVQLMRDNGALRAALRRTITERDYWRSIANRNDPDWQDGLGEYELAERQERDEEARNGR